MTTLSRLFQALALAISVAGCGEQSPVTPQLPGRISDPIQPLPSLEVSVFIPPQVSLVVISWTLGSSLQEIDISGFLVESGAGEAGPWSTLGFTTNNNMVHDLDAGERSCYRVTAVTLNSDLPSSSAVCVVMR